MKTLTDEEVIKFLEGKIINARYNSHISNYKEIVIHAEWVLYKFKRLIESKKEKQ